MQTYGSPFSTTRAPSGGPNYERTSASYGGFYGANAAGERALQARFGQPGHRPTTTSGARGTPGGPRVAQTHQRQYTNTNLPTVAGSRPGTTPFGGTRGGGPSVMSQSAMGMSIFRGGGAPPLQERRNSNNPPSDAAMRAKLIRQVGANRPLGPPGGAPSLQAGRGSALQPPTGPHGGAGRPGGPPRQWHAARRPSGDASSTLVPNLAQRGHSLAPHALAPTTVAPSYRDSGAGADPLPPPSAAAAAGAPPPTPGPPLRMGTGTATFMGTYPGKSANQDASIVMPLRSASSDLEPSPPTGAPPPAAAAAATNDAASDAIIGVYDGHGKHGHLVSNFVRQRLAEELRTIPSLDDPAAAERALSEAHRKTNDALKASGIDVTVSGSTACTALKRGRHLHVANVGDSRAVLGRVDEKTGRVVATNLSHDHKPDSERERKRIEGGGGYVAPSRMPGVGFVGPARVWDRTRMFGLATSRSMGDTVYVGPNRSGVIAEPEVTSHRLDANDRYVIFGTDGVWDHVTSQEAVEIARRHPNPQKASEAIAQCARERWRRNGPMQDDITAVVVGLA